MGEPALSGDAVAWLALLHKQWLGDLADQPARVEQEGQCRGISDQGWFSENRSLPISTRSGPSWGWPALPLRTAIGCLPCRSGGL
jgi:hypothetical protein